MSAATPEQRRRWKQTNPGKVAASRTAWRRNHPDAHRVSRRTWYQRRYGVRPVAVCGHCCTPVALRRYGELWWHKGRDGQRCDGEGRLP